MGPAGDGDVAERRIRDRSTSLVRLSKHRHVIRSLEGFDLHHDAMLFLDDNIARYTTGGRNGCDTRAHFGKKENWGKS